MSKDKEAARATRSRAMVVKETPIKQTALRAIDKVERESAGRKRTKGRAMKTPSTRSPSVGQRQVLSSSEMKEHQETYRVI